ncbi:regulator of telomere elongation helicase 1 homolog isoform X2 [Silene latifolia]|uniref:regulator of telomere elongation helicase 1 homolog isoform X2 n=1 Tax=Silene latifolia TaxID=37657 RepID=UPI003D788971
MSVINPSPMNSFSSELGIPFGTLLEALPVIDVESQVWASVISTGPRDYPFNASYRTADVFAFQNAVGKSLEELFSVILVAHLCFFQAIS